MATKILRRLLARLSANILFVCLYTAAWAAALILVNFVWDAKMIFKIIASVPLIFLAPSVDDFEVAWKNWRQGGAGAGRARPPIDSDCGPDAPISAQGLSDRGSRNEPAAIEDEPA
jgi:hypothetical protein